MRISEHVLKIIQFDKALAPFVNCMKSELGAAFLAGFGFRSENLQLESRQRLLVEWSRYCETSTVPWNNRVVCVDALLAGAKENGLLTGEELLKVRELLALAMKLREELTAEQDEYRSFMTLTKRIRDFTSELDALSVIEDSGRLADHASVKLRNIREQIADVRSSARRSGQRLIEDDKIANMLQERTLVFREGRFLALVRQENVNRFPGLFIERSSSGNSVYMEPRALSPLNNKSALLVRDEADEERHILIELTRTVLAREGAVNDAQNALGEIDLLCAANEVMSSLRWKLPEISKRVEFDLRGARHPLLRERAVPIDVRCGGDFHILVVTGPNTGGKTVVLKTVAVCVAMAWMGLPIPAEEGSIIGAIDSIHADIGDEQSIEQNLSTFSAHLKNIIGILNETGRHGLVLLDELGAGTDPQEGAALGIAILDALRDNGGLIVANTHHNPIKQYALTTPGVETASMEFDLNTLSPTFRLLMRVPGESNALHIAKLYGLDERILKRARLELSEHELSGDEIVARLTERTRLLELREREIKEQERRVIHMKNDYQARLLEIENRRDEILASADDKAAKLINETVEKTREMIKGMDDLAKSAAHKRMNEQNDGLEKIQRLIENRHKKRRARAIEAAAKEAKETAFVPEVGMTVQVVNDGSAKNEFVGIIESIKGKKVRLIAGAIHIEVPIEQLMPTLKKAKLATPPLDTTTEIKVEHVPSSIMVRGMNVDEAMPMVARYLDQAMRAGHTSVVVIHGRGEGILRREVHSLCAGLKYVADYRLGEVGEGGYGVTVVTFKK